MEGVTVKAAAHVDPAALQAAAHIVDVMLDGRKDIAECMADVGAGMLIVPKDDYITDLPEYAHLKGKVDYKDPGRERPFDGPNAVIRGQGGHREQPMASSAEEYLLRTPIDPRVTAHEYAHSIQNLCFSPEDHSKWNAFYETARQVNAFPGAYAMLDIYEFFAVLSTAYLDASLELGNRDSMRSDLSADLPGVWNFLEEIYGVITPIPDSDPRYARYRTEEGDLSPWRIHIGWTYKDEELGYSIKVPRGWRENPYEGQSDATAEFAAFFSHTAGGYLGIRAGPLPNRDSLGPFAKGTRDGWLDWNSKNSLAFKIQSFEERRNGSRESWFMTFLIQPSAEKCPEDAMALFTLSSQYDEKPKVFTLIGGICQNSYGYDSLRRDLLEMLISFD